MAAEGSVNVLPEEIVYLFPGSKDGTVPRGSIVQVPDWCQYIHIRSALYGQSLDAVPYAIVPVSKVEEIMAVAALAGYIPCTVCLEKLTRGDVFTS